MVNTSTLLDALVTKLRLIPGLVTEMNLASNINAFHDEDAVSSDVRSAVAKLTSPGMLVFWDSTQPAGMGSRIVWAHTYRVVFHQKPGAPKGAAKVWEYLVNGVPTGSSLRMLLTEIDPACYAMDAPSISRTFMQIDPTTNSGTEYFEARLTFRERNL